MSKTPHILNVLKQALVTFTTQKRKPELFANNLQTLISLLDKTTDEDVNLPKQFMDPTLWEYPGKAPVSCIEIYEDNTITMGIFILKPNGKLPLHNHPQMHGLIKVIAGKVKIISYSLDTEKTKEIDQKGFHHSDAAIPLKYKASKFPIITAELNEVAIADANSPPCLLEPKNKNLHEIHSIDGAAAFLDILAPPYDLPFGNAGERKCSYYAKLNQVSENIVRLQEIKSPSWYFTDSHTYTGPEIFDDTADLV